MRPDTVSASCVVTHDPHRLRALCALWQAAEREIMVTLQGYSMTPTIRPGSRLKLRCGDGVPKVGDIIAFHREASLVVHRLIAISEPRGNGPRMFICQGDGNSAPDAPIAADEIVGIVAQIAPPPTWVIAQQKAMNAARRVRNLLRRA